MTPEEKAVMDKLRLALQDCYDVMTRELAGLRVIQPEVRQANDALLAHYNLIHKP